MKDGTPLLSIVIPAFNEAASIASVVGDLENNFREKDLSFEIIVVDNGSTDGTGAIVEEMKRKGEAPHAEVVCVFPNEGYGNGILQGLKEAKGDILGWIDADGQSSADDVVRVYRLFLNENYDICKGIRRKRMDSVPRLVQSRIYNFFFNMLFNAPYSDINAKPKFFRRDTYEQLRLSSKDFFIDAELIIKAVRLGYTVGEIPVRWDARQGGTSKVRLIAVWEFVKNLMRYRFLP